MGVIDKNIYCKELFAETRGDKNMRVEQSLLEFLSNQMKCECLSDLRFLSQGQRQHLAQKLERMMPEEADLEEWNDALEYLAGKVPEKTAATARKKLIDFLKNS